MLRSLVAALLISSLALPAEAAIAAKSEKGVRVWRAPAASQAVAAPTLKSASSHCAHRMVVVVRLEEPARRLRIHRALSGDFGRRLPLTTQGFYADRIAAGY